MNLELRTRLVVLSLSVALTGCVGTAPHSELESVRPDSFDIREVQRECLRLNCQEPNSVITRIFAELVRQNGSGCIAFMLPENGWAPWSYWDAYISYLRPLLPESDISVATFRPTTLTKRGESDRLRANTVRLQSQLIWVGASPASISRWSVGDPSGMTPPYENEKCDNSPVLEVTDGVRLVSGSAAPGTTSKSRAQRASRTILVVLNLREKRG